MLEGHARDKRSSLLGQFLSYEESEGLSSLDTYQ